MNDLNSVLFPRRGLYVITPEPTGSGVECLTAVTAALRGGAAVVQYRSKTSPDVALAADLLAVCRAFGSPFIVNDAVELAGRIGADGVHLGRDDVSIGEARHCLGEHAIVGLSCYDDLARALEAEASGASYVAFGRFFASTTKPGASAARHETLSLARDRLRIPVVAIGGINASNAAQVLEAGADLLAVVEAVFGQADPEQAARSLADRVEAHNPCLN